MTTSLKIGQEVLIHGYVDEIRKDTIIIQNEGGYFGTVECEVTDIDMPDTNEVLDKIRAEIVSLDGIMLNDSSKKVSTYIKLSEVREVIDKYRKRSCIFSLNEILRIIDKYKTESETRGAENDE